jgi:hypothetical protein
MASRLTNKTVAHLAPSEGYDEPEILPSSIHPICLMSADGGEVPTL